MPTRSDLLDRILAFPLEMPSEEFNFLVRLRSETGWSENFALQAIREYKKFIYMIVASGRRLSPSPVVDEVWHLHILWTENYLDAFCVGILGRIIHHMPSSAGMTPKLVSDYDATLKLYAQEFGKAAPRALWPTLMDLAKSQSNAPRRFLASRKARIKVAVIAIVAVAALAFALHLGGEGRRLIGLLAIVSTVLYLIIRNSTSGKRGTFNDAPVCSSVCGGSPGGHSCGGHGCGGH